MAYGDHPTSSTMVPRHMVNLPSMSFRADTLATKHCWRARSLPKDYLLSLLSAVVSSPRLDLLRSLKMHEAVPNKWIRTYCRDCFQQFLTANDRKLIKVCCPELRIDPVLYLPASRADRSCLSHWRMN
ncbi:hypothetical protein K501DRAFT_240622 [Backusella circina FSU 941]|nr:hypothetical protein K501DRAFT_240622 [Backusella circina FSU 941]